MEICESIQANDASCVGCAFNCSGMCRIAMVEESMGKLPSYSDVWHIRLTDRRLSMNCFRGYKFNGVELQKNG